MKEYFEKIFTDGQSAFEKILRDRLRDESKTFVVTANPETLMTGQKDTAFDALLRDANTQIVPDGIGIVKAARMLGYNVKERITGVDICQYLLKEADSQKKSVFLFGAKEELRIYEEGP